MSMSKEQIEQIIKDGSAKELRAVRDLKLAEARLALSTAETSLNPDFKAKTCEAIILISEAQRLQEEAVKL